MNPQKIDTDALNNQASGRKTVLGNSYPSASPDTTISNPTVQRNMGPKEAIHAPWILVALVGFIIPTLLVLLIITSLSLGSMLIVSSSNSLLQYGKLARLIALLLFLSPILIVLLIPNYLLAKLYNRWNVPQAKSTVYNTVLSIVALDATVAYLNIGFNLSELSISIGGSILALVNLRIAYLQIGKLKTAIQLVMASISVLIILKMIILLHNSARY